jgi:hypothetical protein
LGVSGTLDHYDTNTNETVISIVLEMKMVWERVRVLTPERPLDEMNPQTLSNPVQSIDIYP